MWFEEHPSFINAVLFGLGMFVALISNYFTFGKDIAYIKGQLEILLKDHEKSNTILDTHAKMEQEISNTLKDIDTAFLRIKLLETKMMGVSNGSGR